MADKAADASGFTPSEQKLLISMIKNLKGSDFPTDWDAVAQECGYKGGPTARNRWGNIKRAKGIGSAASGEDGEKKTQQKKRATSTDAGTPQSKRGKGGKKAPEEEEALPAVEEKDEDQRVVKDEEVE